MNIIQRIRAMFMTREQQIDMQLKSAFRPLKKIPDTAYCKDCGVMIKNPKSYWIDANGNAEFECKKCEEINFYKNSRIPDEIMARMFER